MCGPTNNDCDGDVLPEPNRDFSQGLETVSSMEIYVARKRAEELTLRM